MINLYHKITNSQSLEELTKNAHLLIIVILLVQTFIVTIFRYFNFPIYVTYINLAEISVYLLSMFFFVKKNYETSILITAYGIPIIFAGVVFILKLPFQSCLWFLLSFEIIYIIILTGKANRFVYAAFCALTFFIPGILMDYKYPENIIKFVQVFTLTLIPLILSIFIENQDKKLKTLNQELRKKYKETDTYAQQIQGKNEDLVAFSHIMSHDLKAPLRRINSFADLVMKRLKTKEEAELAEYLSFISESAESMNVLIEDLLVYSKIEVDEIQCKMIVLRELIEEVLLLFRFDISEKQVEVIVEDLPTIYGDAHILKTVFHNLISNAIKYQPKEETHRPMIKIWGTTERLQHYVYIKDNGIGIKEEHIKELFTPFRRFHTISEYKGTGLGLSICNRVMEKHKGKIQLADTSPEGTVFRLTLPVGKMV